ncbi:MAG: hypothetical protein COV07_02955 [Candidatus Vogelbacteria bacterium CG10_big_fil_rev_8_21_14_0_10_45_14]|uniref:Cation-transporting P-type ATPase N-terminal domain-containing protein n=1 Tax=Candidatus Vogelbacteria bacterium CG10_big_fil_rev_8_21_14_0_10_45_14 TaxID=1975042 RepID=A0A2H0RJK5_9BACT|nr:MAG: hypothetical protein COV07_02955 [Candidatus Vogelbacteria bacterium CG10_big_fil_rev_8_21_14_0_10_45_14]
MKSKQLKLNETTWYKLSVHDCVANLSSSLTHGLSTEVVRELQKKNGLNKVEKGKRKSSFDILLSQFKSPLIIVLVVAGIITFLLDEWADTLVIYLVVGLNAGIGFYQERRAETAFEKISEGETKEAVVLRDGKRSRVDESDIVVGDIVYLSAGDYVPADCRIVESHGLQVNESMLTGEWVSVSKDKDTISKKTALSERKNMIYMGTLVSSGEGIAIVCETGHATELGHIATLLIRADRIETNFEKSITSLAKMLTGVIASAIVLIFLVGVYRGEEMVDLFMLSIAVAVAAIPSGLPVVVTVVLAVGLENLLREGGLVKNLLAAETLGSTTVVLTDKTGTLTKAEMLVKDVILPHGNDDRESESVLEAAVLAADGLIEEKGETKKEIVVTGHPIERAIIIAGIESGIHREEILKRETLLERLPFTPERRYRASLVAKQNGSVFLYALGAPESVLAHSDSYMKNGEPVKMLSSHRQDILAEVERGASKGMLFVAVALKKVKEHSFDQFGEKKEPLARGIFLGLIGLHDPVRESVPMALRVAQDAGVRVVMVTGDHAGTAGEIAQIAGIVGHKGEVLTGEMVEKLADEKLGEKIRTASVFARVLPEQKLRILQTLQGQGEIVAMTGDGVNDAPALVHADIGIAPDSGTSVAKEASDLILLDGSFSVIVSAIKEGRRILDNLKKSVAFLLSTGFSELAIVGGALLLGLPLPILPTQILWANVVEEGFMSVAYAFEPAEPDIMKRSPRGAEMKSILTQDLKKLIGMLAFITGIISIFLYILLLNTGMGIDTVRTIMFALLSLDAIFFSFSIKNLHIPIWRENFWNNRYLLFAFVMSILALALALLLPPLQNLLSLSALSTAEFLIILCMGLMNLLVIEIGKKILFPRKQNMLE